MHIPNGFIDPKLSTGLGFASAGALAYSFAKVREIVTSPVAKKALAGAGNTVSILRSGAKRAFTAFGEKFILKMGIVASIIFAAQMFNFPIAEGTSGHLLGGVLAAVILGPWAGAIIISTILFIQSAIFADGGILVLGANIFNMAVIGSIAGFFIYKYLRNLIKVRQGMYIAAGIAAFISVVLAAGSAALELGISGTYEISQTLKAMLSVHALIGLAEGVITVCILGIVSHISDDFIKEGSKEDE